MLEAYRRRQKGLSRLCRRRRLPRQSRRAFEQRLDLSQLSASLLVHDAQLRQTLDRIEVVASHRRARTTESSVRINAFMGRCTADASAATLRCAGNQAEQYCGPS